MSYSTYVYIGWYVVATPTNKRIKVGETKIRVCSANDKHKHGNNEFCGVCGSQIISSTKPKMQGISLAWHFFNETDPIELEYASVGLATVNDMAILGNCHAIFPEFLPEQFKTPVRKEIIMAPGYTMIERERDGDVIELSQTSKPSDEWINTVDKVLGSSDTVLKYGAVVEVV